MAKNSPKAGPGLAISITVMVGGFLLGLAGYVFAFQIALDVATNSPHQIPGTIEETYDAGTYEIHVETLAIGELLGGEFEEDEFLGQVDNVDITVHDPSGQLLPVSAANPELATTRGFTFYQHIGSFDATEEGTYVIEVDTPQPTTLVIGESITSAWRDALPWGIAAMVGSVLAIAGLIMLVLGIVRRQKTAKNQAGVHAPGVGTSSVSPAPATAPQRVPPPPKATAPAPPPPPPPPGAPNPEPPLF